MFLILAIIFTIIGVASIIGEIVSQVRNEDIWSVIFICSTLVSVTLSFTFLAIHWC